MLFLLNLIFNFTFTFYSLLLPFTVYFYLLQFTFTFYSLLLPFTVYFYPQC